MSNGIITTNDTKEPSGAEALEIMVRESAGVPTTDLIVEKIIKIAGEIPENVNQINPSVADYLAGRFLVGINLCGELAAFASGHTLKMLSNKKREYSVSYHTRAMLHGCKAVKDKELYPYMDPEYIAADNKHIEAVIFEKMVDEKVGILNKAHYMMRKLADKEPTIGFKDSHVIMSPVNNSGGFQSSGTSVSDSNTPVDNTDWDNMFE